MSKKIIIIALVIVFFIWILFSGSINWYYTEYFDQSSNDQWVCEKYYPEYYKTSDGQCWEDWRNDPFKDSPIRLLINP